MVFKATYEAPVYEYHTARVAGDERALGGAVASNRPHPSAERDVLESATAGGYEVSAEAGNASGFTGPLAAADLHAPDPYDADRSAYIRYEGRFYYVLGYISGE